MPQVMKVDSVWTTLVETPHPSLKTKDKILHVLYLLYLPGNLKSQRQQCEVTHQRWGNLPVHVISHFNLTMFTCRWGDPPRWDGWSARPGTLSTWVKFCQVNVSRWGYLTQLGFDSCYIKVASNAFGRSFASLKVKAMQHYKVTASQRSASERRGALTPKTSLPAMLCLRAQRPFSNLEKVQPGMAGL